MPLLGVLLHLLRKSVVLGVMNDILSVKTQLELLVTAPMLYTAERQIKKEIRKERKKNKDDDILQNISQHKGSSKCIYLN